jgi:hypothetical protein
MGGAFVIIERIVGQGTEREQIYLLSNANKLWCSRMATGTHPNYQTLSHCPRFTDSSGRLRRNYKSLTNYRSAKITGNKRWKIKSNES